jgi:tRNA U34 5-methylaminomethyl-2-thiouridine-forming methyltransferase MnmC
MSYWSKNNYAVEITKDGSPTLSWLGNTESSQAESMHHSGGAFSETHQIYSSVIARVLNEIPQQTLRFASVGLGLGYVELSIANEFLKVKKQNPEFNLKKIEIDSFEADPFLEKNFLDWIEDKSTPETNELYALFGDRYDFPIADIKAQLRSWYASHLWKFKGPLLAEFCENRKYHCVLYDAFSSKTTPFLWEEDFLKTFLKNELADESFFSTYACTGALKRALRENHFEVIVREGFMGKRNSTLGFKLPKNI